VWLGQAGLAFIRLTWGHNMTALGVMLLGAVCSWAIGMSHMRSTSHTMGDMDFPYIYKKGPAFGMPGVRVDGMDVLKVRLTAGTCCLLLLLPVRSSCGWWACCRQTMVA
jgi:hypothetical protein